MARSEIGAHVENTLQAAALIHGSSSTSRKLVFGSSMRQVILVMLMLTPFVAAAQVGSVRYSHTYPVMYTRYFAYEAFAREAAGLEPRVLETHATISRSLVFDTAASLMYPTDKEHAEPGEIIRTEGREHIDTTYVDYGSDTFVESRVLGTQIYLVSDKLPTVRWQLESEERVYLGFRVMKATAVVDSTSIEAWFTPDIPIPAGPGLYGGLPGLILMVTNAVDGEVYAAEAIDLDEFARVIVPPTRGRTLSNEDYLQARTADILEDERRANKRIRDIEEGRVIIIRRGEQ